MKKVSVAHLKAHFSEILQSIRDGEEFVIEFGKKHEKLAVLLPYKKFRQKRQLGALKNQASFQKSPHFKMIDEEFLES